MVERVLVRMLRSVRCQPFQQYLLQKLVVEQLFLSTCRTFAQHLVHMASNFPNLLPVLRLLPLKVSASRGNVQTVTECAKSELILFIYIYM